MVKGAACAYPLLSVLFFSAGCGPILLTGAGSGIDYTLTNIAYKTVNFPIEKVETAVHIALKKMEIQELFTNRTKGEVKITSETADLKIYIDLVLITHKTTKISVDVRKDIVLKDKATATAIIDQTEKGLVK